MDITDFLKDINHWGLIAVCVCGIVALISNFFKNSMNENIRIAMTVTAVIFLASIIIWVLFFSNDNDNSKENIVFIPENQYDKQQLELMKKNLDAALISLDIEQEKISSLDKQIQFLTENRDSLLKQLTAEKTYRANAEKRLSEDSERLNDTSTEYDKTLLAFRNIQSKFNAYKESADNIITGLGQNINELQKQLDSERVERNEAEKRLSAQMNIHSGDIRQLQSMKSDYDRAMHILFFINNDDEGYMKYYYNQALNLFREKAKQGSTEAYFLMGYMLDPQHARIKSGGIKQNVNEAISHYEKAALQGHTDAQYLLGNLYYSVKNDHTKAAQYYKLAADKGHKNAQEMLKHINGNK